MHVRFRPIPMIAMAALLIHRSPPME